MIAIKAKELISKVREVAVKVHQSAWKQNVKGADGSHVPIDILRLLVPKRSIIYSLIIHSFNYLFIVIIYSFNYLYIYLTLGAGCRRHSGSRAETMERPGLGFWLQCLLMVRIQASYLTS